MSGEYISGNYDLAKAEADKVDAQIIETLKSGHSFRVEAGAGSGKTYSLNRAIEWIQEHKWSDYRRKKQNVVCITYTNAAVDVIAERLAKDSFIIPSTIHSFAWNAIKQYQSVLIDEVTKNLDFLPEEGDFSKVTEVAYTLGHRYKEHGIQYLYHDDVLKLFCLLLDNAKFRRVFADKYPLILIDEYQDSYKPIINRFIAYFIEQGTGPQFGFFGDAWQTIYGNLEGFNGEGFYEELCNIMRYHPYAGAYAMHKDRIAGFIQLAPARRRDLGVGYVSLVYMCPEFRNKGIGAQLIGYAVGQYRRLGRTSVELGCAKCNAHGQHFYEKLGFRVVGTVPGLSDDLLLEHLEL